MKIKVILVSICFYLLGIQTMDAQKGMRHHIDVDQISQDLELSETQVADLNRLKADIQNKKEALRNEKEMDRELMHQYKAQWKLEMDAILTVPQQEKMAAIKAERMQKREAMKEVFRKEKREHAEKITAYEEANIRPVMEEKRMELEKKISKDDKVKIDILRQIAAKEKEVLNSKKEEDFMKGQKGPHGKRGHHKKGPHIKKWMEDNPETYALAQEMVEKYSDNITSIQEDLIQDKELWHSEIEAIKSGGQGMKSGGQGMKCDPKDCKPGQCDPKDCKPGQCDKNNTCKPSDDCVLEEGKRHGFRGKHHGKKGHHLSEEERSFGKQLHFLLIDTPETEARSLTDVKFPALAAYPNPASGSQTLTLTLDEEQKVGIVVIDVRGKELMKVQKGKLDVGEHRFEVDLSALVNNVYFYRVTTKTGSKLVQFVVART